MATEVGSLTLKVDTGDVRRAKGDVDKLSQSAGNLENEFEDVAGAAKTAGDAADDFGNKAKGPLGDLPDAANDSGEGFDVLGRKAGMAGIQVEQLVGQIAAGQNPLRAIGVQAADLGFILGVPLVGAAIGVTAAIASTIPAFLGMGRSIEDLKESMRDFNQIMAINAVTAAYQLDQAFVDLANTSRDLAEAKLNNQLSLALLDIGTASEMVKMSVKAMGTEFYDAGEGAAQFGGNLGAVQATAAKFGIPVDSVRDFQDALDDVGEGLEGAGAKFATMVSDFEASGQTTQEFRELASAVLEAIEAQDGAQNKAAALGHALQNLDEAIEKGVTSSSEYAASTEGMIAAMEQEAYQAGMSAKQLALLAVVRQGEKEGLGPDALADLYARAEALYDEAEAAREVVRAKQEEAREREAASKAAERAERAKEAAAVRAAEAEEQAAIRTQQSTLARVMQRNDTELEALERKLAEERRLLDEAEFAGTISAQEYEDALAEIAEYGAQRRGEITAKELADRGQGSLELTDALINMENLLFDQKDKKSKAALRIGVNLANAEKRENAKKIMSDAYTAAMSAYKSLAGIPFIGPALGAAAAAAILATGAQYATQSLTGRALGGQVRPGESYMVGERGPEVLTMGNTGGSITPNEAIRNNESNQVVNKTANVSFNIQANDTQGFDELLVQRRGLIINVINEALNDQGKAAIA
jgi:hypothetical protein